MILQAYIDDSAKGEPHLFVLAGYVAPAESWAALADEWRALLSQETGYLKRKRFKMNERHTFDEDKARNPLYYRLIEKHVLAAISFTIKTSLLRQIVDETFPEEYIDKQAVKNPYHYAFTSIIATVARFQHQIGLHSPIDFVFDEAMHEKASCINGWERFKLAAAPDTRELMGRTPGFEDDEEVLPLQAADLYAWWVRRWQRNGEVIYAPLDDCQFDWLKAKEIPTFHIAPTEADIRERYRQMRERAERDGRVPKR